MRTSLTLFLTALILTGAGAPQAAPLPNIVLVLADDLGYGDPRCYNPESKIATPAIDRLAAQGVRLTDAHTPSSVCTPTRYGLLTGRYCWRTSLKRGVLDGYSPLLIETGRTTLPSLLKQKGYATGAVGKWHLGLGSEKKTDYAKPLRPGPVTTGFDSFFGIPASLDMPPYVFVENEAPTVAPSETIAASEMRRKGGNGFWRAGAIAPGFRHVDVLPAITEKAVGFIRKRSADARTPFFLYVALTAPHTPWMPTDEFRGKTGAGFYGDFVAQVDDTLRKVLETLDETKVADRTLVFFTSDNGAHWLPEDIEKWGHRANGSLRGQKADIWEAGHRVPFIARWPGRIPAGTTSEETACLTDLMATVAAAVESPLPADAGEDSFNLLPALLGRTGAVPIRDATIHHSGDGLFALRQGSWKIVMGLGSGGFTLPKKVDPKEGEPAGQLYDLAKDPREERNVWAQNPEVVTRLTALLEKIKSDGRSRK